MAPNTGWDAPTRICDTAIAKLMPVMPMPVAVLIGDT